GSDRDRLRAAAVALAGHADAAGDVDDAPGARAAGDLAEGWVLSGREDHALLPTFPAAAALPPELRALGVVRPADEHGAGVRLDGAVPHRAPGWDHLRA